MTLLYPIGLLGLISLLILFLIYIIKPNFQQKRVSSTYIWKLSLKYRKKRIPINKLRNILIILCQVLALASCAIILSQPNKILRAQVDYNEMVLIIDSSASMRTEHMGETRFQRAIDYAIADLNSMPTNTVVSVIIADANPKFFDQNVTEDKYAQLAQRLQDLSDDPTACSYASSDVTTAISLCEEIFRNNQSAKITLYTDTDYSYIPENISVVDVKLSEEWNAGILNAYSVFEEGYYEFHVEVASYVQSNPFTLNIEVYNPNVGASGYSEKIKISEPSVQCPRDGSMTIMFKFFAEGVEVPTFPESANMKYSKISEGNRIRSYHSAYVSIEEADSFNDDNGVWLYGGQKEILNVQYVSVTPNPFVKAALLVLSNRFDQAWDIRVEEKKATDEFSITGFDLYIFEHFIPEHLPTDGIVYLSNPENNPFDNKLAGFSVAEVKDNSGRSIHLEQGESHKMLKEMVVDRVTVSRYLRLTDLDSTFTTLMSCGGDPVMLIKDEDNAKVIVSAFSLHYSNFPITAEFPLFFKNIIDYFFPQTVNGYTFNVNDKISFNARGEDLTVTNEQIQFSQKFTSFPAVFSANIPGTYQLEQFVVFSGKTVIEPIYIKIPAIESNIVRVEDGLAEPFKDYNSIEFYKDLLLFVAIALVTLLFAEWLLHVREEA